tara:strand:+ start:67 stop:462 length:396 start_codon:yes stop_codon:yes gene_type:complete
MIEELKIRIRVWHFWYFVISALIAFVSFIAIIFIGEEDIFYYGLGIGLFMYFLFPPLKWLQKKMFPQLNDYRYLHDGDDDNSTDRTISNKNPDDDSSGTSGEGEIFYDEQYDKSDASIYSGYRKPKDKKTK